MKCTHLSGAGNDFLVIDARGKTLDFSALALKLCKQTGADGFLALDHSHIADFKLHFYNPDGSRGEMCGNGSRCLCRYAYDNGIAGEKMVIETDAGLVPGERLDENQYRVQLNNPSIADLNRKKDVSYVELGDPGIPHVVKEIPGLTFDRKDELRPLALQLRDDPAFPKGVNVNFYTWLEEGTVRVLTYERGVEEYTLACGTGCGSIAVTLWMQGKLPGGVLTAQNQGGILKLTLEGGEKVERLILEGPTEILGYYEV